MDCTQRMEHVIREGDSLYKLAGQYGLTVPELLVLNPGVNPYNLQVGSRILVCPGADFIKREGVEENLSEEMRLVWLQHVYWTRMLLISLAEYLADKDEVANRLLQNPNDIASIFANFYSSDVATRISQLLAEHLGIGAALITALRDMDMEEANALNDQWYINADKMAELFARINPHYDLEEMREILYRHLDLTKEEVGARLQKEFLKDILAFGKVEEEALEMADEFTQGIESQFPQRFE